VNDAGRKARRASSVFFGWWIVLGGIGIQILTSGLLNQAYGAYVVTLQAQFGWSKTAFSIAYAIQQVESGLLGPIQGWMLDRFGPRFVMRIGIVLLGSGFILFSQINSLPLFYASFLIMSIGMSMAGFVSVTTTLINWFERKRGTALGIMQTGGAIGGLMVPLVAWSLTTYGWRATAFGSGVAILVLGMPLVQLMRHRPEDYGMLPDGVKPAAKGEWPPPGGETLVATSAMSRVDFTVREALHTGAFWFLSIGHSLALFVVGAMSVHLIPHLTENIGTSLAAAATVVSIMIGAMMAGQLTGGVLGDRFSKRWISVIAMFGHCAAMMILVYAGSLTPVIVAAIIQGFSHGFRGVQMMPLRADYFGRASFGTIMGFSSTVMILGTVSGPIIAGQIADRTGDYRLAFQIMAATALAGAVFFFLAKKPEPPVRTQTAR
jgi:sugar phosphate permease